MKKKYTIFCILLLSNPLIGMREEKEFLNMCKKAWREEFGEKKPSDIAQLLSREKKIDLGKIGHTLYENYYNDLSRRIDIHAHTNKMGMIYFMFFALLLHGLCLAHPHNASIDALCYWSKIFFLFCAHRMRAHDSQLENLYEEQGENIIKTLITEEFKQSIRRIKEEH